MRSGGELSGVRLDWLQEHHGGGVEWKVQKAALKKLDPKKMKTLFFRYISKTVPREPQELSVKNENRRATSRGKTDVRYTRDRVTGYLKPKSNGLPSTRTSGPGQKTSILRVKETLSKAASQNGATDYSPSRKRPQAGVNGFSKHHVRGGSLMETRGSVAHTPGGNWLTMTCFT